MTLETLVTETIESINNLSKYTKTHQTSVIDYELLDALETATSELEEVAYELEARVQDDEEDLEDYEPL